MDTIVKTSDPAVDTIAHWPAGPREAAQLVIDAYGPPHEVSESELRWLYVGPWKRIVAQRVSWAHAFPAPHEDSVESWIDYRVPVDRVGDIARFDGSVMPERTTGELSARCHDEQANLLALNLAHEIVTGARTVDNARAYYAQEFLDAWSAFGSTRCRRRPPRTRTSASSPTNSSRPRGPRAKPSRAAEKESRYLATSRSCCWPASSSTSWW